MLLLRPIEHRFFIMLKAILLLNPLYVSLFWAIILFISPRGENLSKRFLGGFMLIAFVLYLSHFFYFEAYWRIYSYLDGIYIFSSLSLVPLFYIYVRLLTVDCKLEFKTHFKYLVLPLCFGIVAYCCYWQMSLKEEYQYLALVLSGISKAEGIHLVMKRIYILSRIVFVVQVVFYFILSWRLIRKHNTRIADFYSDIEDIGLGWLQVLNISMILAAFLSIVMAVLGRENFLDSSILLLIPSATFSVLLFVFGYLGNKQRSICWGGDSVLDEEVETEELIDDLLLSRLVNLFEEDKLFRDKSLKIWDVSEKLGTNRTYVSRLINRGFNQNFCSFVNRYRVEDVKSMLDRDSYCSLEEIAEETGFGSANSLYRAFLQHEGVSVSDYRNRVGK